MSECVQSTECLAHGTHVLWVPLSLITFQHRASIVTSGMLGVVEAKDFKWEQEGLLQLAPRPWGAWGEFSSSRTPFPLEGAESRASASRCFGYPSEQEGAFTHTEKVAFLYHAGETGM